MARAAVIFSSAVLGSAAALPNIIYLTTDDQDLLLGSMQVMPHVQSLVQRGAAIDHAVVASPVCCPSRTATLTGRYPHNLQDDVFGWCGNFLTDHMNATFVDVLHDAGYATHISGKLINEMGSMCAPGQAFVPPAWDDFFAMCNEVMYYKNTFNDNGKLTITGTDPASYLTSVIGNRTLNWLKANAGGPKPFFVYLAPHAPHLPATPAPWYFNASTPSITAPRTPSWNYISPDKHWLLASQPPMSPFLINASDELYRNRLRTLMSVDDMVRDVVQLLTDMNVLDNTYIIYTSDHGYHLGQFGVLMEKREPYETDIRIPMFFSGPGIAANTTLTSLATNVDMAATILDMAGGLTMPGTDGRSLLPILTGAAQDTRHSRVVEMYGGQDAPSCYTTYQILGPCSPEPPCKATPGWPVNATMTDAPSNTYTALRILNESHNVLYVEFRGRAELLVPASTNWTELYNISADPWQLVNEAMTAPASLLQAYSDELWSVAACSGAACP